VILAQKIAGGRGKRSYHHRRDEKRANLEANRSRYRQAECAGKSKIFDEFCIVSGYPRKYAIHLRAHHRWRPLSPAGDERRSVLSIMEEEGCAPGEVSVICRLRQLVDANGRSNRLVIDLHTRQAHTEGVL